MGFVLFAILMVLFIFVCIPLQSAWGVTGLVATEAIFLILAVIFGLVFRIPFKEMFPVKKFTARDLFGSLFLATGGVLFGLISVAVVGILFPVSLGGGDVQALNQYIGGDAGYIFTMFALALMPAICEESIHRGAILTCFRSIKKDWLIILIMAVFFGVFHLSALRFISTAIMGACLTYILIRKNNMLLTSLTHFILNISSSTISYLSVRITGSAGTDGNAGPAIQITADSMKVALGTYLMIGFGAPFLIVIGLMLLDPSSHKKIRFLFAGILSVIMLISAITITITSNMGTNMIAQSSISYTVEVENTDSPPIGFSVENEGQYTMAVVIMNTSGAGTYSIRIEDSEGKVVSSGMITSSAFKTYTAQIELEPGNYILYINNGTGTKGNHPMVSFQLNKS